METGFFAREASMFVERLVESRLTPWQVVACVSVNDAFVMKAWGEQQKAGRLLR